MSEITLPPMFGAVNTASAVIDAAPEAVWKILFDRARWIEDFIGKAPIDGPADAVGERARFTRRAPDGSLRSTCIYARFPPAPGAAVSPGS